MPPLDPQDELFCRAESPAALLAAAEELSARSGRTLDELERLTMRQVHQLAVATFRDQLPEFWVQWAAWHDDWGTGEMGDRPVN